MELTPRTISEHVDHADQLTCLRMLAMLKSEGDTGDWTDALSPSWAFASTDTLRHVVKCHLLALEVNS